MLRKLDQTIAATHGNDSISARYKNADALIDDLVLLEKVLTEAKSEALASDVVRPLRRAVEIFRFSTVRLDIRQNTTRTTAALHELWRLRTGQSTPPSVETEQWRQWVLSELSAPRKTSIDRNKLTDETRDVIEMFEIVEIGRAHV